MKNLPWERPDMDPSNNIEFIVHTDLTVNGFIDPPLKFFFPKGTPATFYPNTQAIYVFGVRICYSHSHVGHKHFCRNEDGKGLLRRKYTYALADADRKRILKSGYTARFTDEEAHEIANNWKFFLNPEHPSVFLFNDNFYNANIDDLKRLADFLHIHVNENENDNKKEKEINGNDEIKILSTSELSIKS